MLNNKKIILGITGCSPASEALELAGQLKKLGADVHIVMTENAQQFVTPLMVQRCVSHPIQINAFELPRVWDSSHKSLTAEADLMVVAPASANTIGKAAGGIADNLLTTTIMSMRGPKVLAMHINDMMYRSPAVQRNIRLLKEDGFIFADNGNPEYPSLFPQTDRIVDTIKKALDGTSQG